MSIPVFNDSEKEMGLDELASIAAAVVGQMAATQAKYGHVLTARDYAVIATHFARVANMDHTVKEWSSFDAVMYAGYHQCNPPQPAKVTLAGTRRV